MDGLTKGALGATVVLMVGAMAFAIANSSKNRDNLERENLALREQILGEQQQIERDRDAAREREMEEFRKAQEDGQAEIARLRAEMAAAAVERSAEEAERTVLSETIAEKVRREDAAEEAELSPLQRKIKEAASFGKVTDVNSELGFVVLAAGSAQGLEVGQRFNIRRDKYIITEIEVHRVENAGNSVANIDANKLAPGQEIRVGDDIIGHPIY